MMVPQPIWDRAMETWLAARAGSAHTRRAYEADVRAFSAFCGARPGEVGRADVTAWQRAMRREGLAVRTINRRLSALSSFFDFCVESMLAAHNPVEGVKRARPADLEDGIGLSLGELRALFWSIPRDSVVGLRDRALVFCVFYTGRRATEVRELKWEEVEALPPAAFEAVIAYLQAAGWLATMEDEDLVFTALSDVATRLPSVDEMPRGGLSASFVNRVIRKCARRAGLAWEANARALRQAAGMLQAAN